MGPCTGVFGVDTASTDARGPAPCPARCATETDSCESELVTYGSRVSSCAMPQLVNRCRLKEARQPGRLSPSASPLDQGSCRNSKTPRLAEARHRWSLPGTTDSPSSRARPERGGPADVRFQGTKREIVCRRGGRR